MQRCNMSIHDVDWYNVCQIDRANVLGGVRRYSPFLPNRSGLLASGGFSCGNSLTGPRAGRVALAPIQAIRPVCHSGKPTTAHCLGYNQWRPTWRPAPAISNEKSEPETRCRRRHLFIHCAAAVTKSARLPAGSGFAS